MAGDWDPDHSAAKCRLLESHFEIHCITVTNFYFRSFLWPGWLNDYFVATRV